jgi:hypothetical protein
MIEKFSLTDFMTGVLKGKGIEDSYKSISKLDRSFFCNLVCECKDISSKAYICKKWTR